MPRVFESDVFAVLQSLEDAGELFPLIWADPPYGGVIAEEKRWGKWDADRYVELARACARVMRPGGACYIWGGVGKPKARHFFEFQSRVERETGLTLFAPITWKKKRAYGTQRNYLFTREEVAALCLGDYPDPFFPPLTNVKRGYKGYNKKFPALSEFLRYGMVWDVPELFKGKRHECEKPKELARIALFAHTKEGDSVLDLFSGSGSFSECALAMGRMPTAVENAATEAADLRVRLLGTSSSGEA